MNRCFSACLIRLFLFLILLNFSFCNQKLSKTKSFLLEDKIFEPVSFFNGYSIFLRYENHDIGNKFISIIDTLTKNGYRVHLEGGLGKHKGNLMLYGDPNCKQAINEIKKICGNSLDFTKLDVVRFETRDNSYKKQEIVIQLEDDFFK